MAGLLSAAMLAELQSAYRSVIPVLELYLTAATRRYGAIPIASASLGEVKGRVIKWGRISRAVSDRDNALVLNSTSVTLEDTDAAFSSLLEDSNAASVRGTRAVIKLISPNVAAGSWFTLFDGYVENYSMESAFVWTLQLHPNDQPLLGVFPKTAILPSDFPNVGDKTLYGEYVPLIYGIHDSRGSSDAGMVPCPYVDRIGFRYLVAHGWVTVDRVYKDGTLTSASNYTATHPTINGRLYTLIDFTADQVDAVITADVTGYETAGDGTSDAITGVDALAHLLSNFVFGDYQGGNWGATSAFISSALFTTAQSFLTDMGWEKVSRRYGGESQTNATTAIAELCSSLQLNAFFTNAGLFAVAPDDHRALTLWYDQPRWVRYDLDEAGEEGSLRIEYDRDSITDRISVQYILDSAGNKYVQTTEVRDVSITEQNASDLQLPWSHASLT